MSILPSLSLRGFSIFQQSMIQANELPLCEEDEVVFGIDDKNVFTPAITLWAMISQFLFKQEGRSCKAAAGRVVSLIAQTAGRVVAQNAGNYCRAKAKIPVATIQKIALRLASQAEIGCLKFDDLISHWQRRIDRSMLIGSSLRKRAALGWPSQSSDGL